jgi:hypothetical protein
MPSATIDRHPSGYALRAANVFGPHLLVDLRVVANPLHRIVLAASRLEGSTNILAELCKHARHPSRIRREFDEMYKHYAATSPFPQPKDIKEQERWGFQKIIDDVLGVSTA